MTFWTLSLKYAILSKEALLLVMFSEICDFGECLEKTLNETSVYHLSIWHAAKKHYTVYMRCLQIYWAVFIKTFYVALIPVPKIWFIALLWETIQISGSLDFTRNSHTNIPSKQVLSISECILKMFLSLWELQQIRKFLSTLSLMFIFMLLYLEYPQERQLQRKNLILQYRWQWSKF